MPFYVTRSTARHRNVIGAWSEPQFKYQEEVADDDASLGAYLNRSRISQKLAAMNLSSDDLVQLARLDELVPRVFVDRDADGMIVAEYDEPQRPGHEGTHPDDAGLAYFRVEQQKTAAD